MGSGKDGTTLTPGGNNTGGNDNDKVNEVIDAVDNTAVEANTDNNTDDDTDNNNDENNEDVIIEVKDNNTSEDDDSTEDENSEESIDDEIEVLEKLNDDNTQTNDKTKKKDAPEKKEVTITKEGKLEVKKRKKEIDEENRRDTIKKELVIHHNHEKEERRYRIEKEITGEKGVDEKSKEPGKIAKGLNKWTKYSGIATDVINMGVGIGNSIMGVPEALADNTPKGGNNTAAPSSSDTDNTTGDGAAAAQSSGLTDKQQMQLDHKPYKQFNAAVSMGTAAVGMLNSGIGAVTSATKIRSKNKRARWSSYFGLASSAGGLLANAAKFTGGGLAFGDQTKEKTKAATNWMGFTGAVAGLGASAASLTGGIVDWRFRKNLMKDSSKISENVDEDDINAKREEMRQKRKTALDENDHTDSKWINYKDSKKELNSLKAKKYAMKQAEQMNSAKASQMPKGIAGTLGGLFSVASSFAGIIPGWADSTLANVVKAAGGAIGSLTTLFKQSERISDLRTAKKVSVKKHEVVDEYIDRKMGSYRKEFKDFDDNHPDFANLGENEKKRIIIGRLGVDIPITDEDISSSDYDKAFNSITHKRAVNILNSNDEDRKEMLKALRLEEDASLQDIESVLKGE